MQTSYHSRGRTPSELCSSSSSSSSSSSWCFSGVTDAVNLLIESQISYLDLAVDLIEVEVLCPPWHWGY